MVFVIDGAEWTLDLREGKGTLVKGPPPEKADITLTIKGRRPAARRAAVLLWYRQAGWAAAARRCSPEHACPVQLAQTATL